MNKVLLIGVSVLGLFLSSEVYSASSCTPDFVPKCKCQFPVYDGKELKCGDDYCAKKGKTCMNNGSCCTTPNQAKTQCCDTNGNGVANDDTCCPALETEGCETEVDTTTGCKVCKEKGSTIEEKCQEAGGTMSGSFCRSKVSMDWNDAGPWCLKYGMELISVLDGCPDFDATADKDGDGYADFSMNAGNWICETSFVNDSGWTASKYPNRNDNTYLIFSGYGHVVSDGAGRCEEFDNCWPALCK